MTYYIIYETTNLINGKKYIGIHKTSNIDDGYIGSGVAIEKAIIKYGKENFKREILEFCLSYDELIDKEKIYVNKDWVSDKSNYNLKTGGQSSGILSEESKNKISETLKRKYKNGEISIDFYFKQGMIPWNKDKMDIYSENSLEKMSESAKKRYESDESHGFKKNSNNLPWNKGLKTGPQSEETKKKKSETLKNRYSKKDHHAKGKSPWNKGKTGVQVPWNKGKEMKKDKCKYCDKEMDILNLNKYHNENCKLKILQD
jgi:hypothetical protein